MTAAFPDLAGRIAVVTGGSKGIGEAVSRLLAANGAKVAVVARGSDAVDKVAGDLRAHGATALGITADCGNAADVARVRDQVEEKLGQVDILVVFAGGVTQITPILELEEDDWRSIVDSNLNATFVTVKAFLPGMVERRSGAIVTMSSGVARVVDRPIHAGYAAAKGGIISFTRHVATEVGSSGVRVNCVAPATVLTGRTKRATTEAQQEAVAAMSVLGRWGTPEDVAQATVYLCSDAASWITGITLDVAGGRVMT